MKKVLCIVLVAVLTALNAGAQSSSVKRLESLRAQLENDIKILNRQLDQNIKNSNKVLSSLTLVRRKINAREQLIATYDKQLKELNDSLYLCQKELGRLQARHDTLSLYYSRLVRGAYKNRDTRLWYMYILSSDSMGQAFNRFDYFRNLSTQMSAEALKLREASAQLEAQKQRLNKLKAQVNETRKKVVSERSQLQSEEGDASRMVSQLKKDRRTYEKQLKEKNRQKEELNRKIAELIRQQTRKQGEAGKKTGGGSSKTTSTAVDTKLSNEFAANKGRLPWPVEGTIMERFGKHSHPVYKNVQLPQNNGVTLVVKHGAQASVSVKAGQKISIGQVVGTVDTIGGEDLFHFELWKGSTPQNPESWLRQ